MTAKRSLILLSAACVLSCGAPERGDEVSSALAGLDKQLQEREAYVGQKLQRLDAYRNLAAATMDPDGRIEVEMLLSREFFPFSFDSTQAHLKAAQALALSAGSGERYLEATIQLGHLYEKAGNYLEASAILLDQIDSAALPPSLKAEYYWTLYDFSSDVSGNSGVVEQHSLPPADAFRDRLLAMLPPDSPRARWILRDRYIEMDALSRADSIGRLLLSQYSPNDRDYAIHAFYQSIIEERKGNRDGQILWLIRSAECDIVNAVRDYASLTMVAQNILPTDVDRSFRYLRIAQEDALSYNARLRPWQISRFLLQVENAYQERQAHSARMRRMTLILLAVLAVILSVLSYFLVVRSRKLSRMRRELERSNASLKDANAELIKLNQKISRADQVKEKYILLFLRGLSNQISVIRTEDNRFRNLLKQGNAAQLLKDLSVSGRSEKAREAFYKTFDSTFLALYPDFVSEFNAMLRPESRVVPPEGQLSTGHRIFALIRLGIDDSKEIASMLDYSVSTIYNYKVSLKNAALEDRDHFEHRVKMIG